ncbi:helix-turn-helix domain-containing protein [Myxococcota bacterium]
MRTKRYSIPNPKLWTISDLCKYLRISRSTAYQWVSDNKLPYTRINGLLRFEEQAVRDYLREANSSAEKPDARNEQSLRGRRKQPDNTKPSAFQWD